MAYEEYRNKSFAAASAWPLLVLTAVFLAYLGLSAVAYFFMGVPKPPSGPAAWMTATMGGLQAVAAAAAFVQASRRDLRGTTITVAAGIVLGWIGSLPSVDFNGDDKVSPIYLGGSALFAIAGAVLAWRNVYPTAAALLVSAMTIVGLAIGLAFGIIIAMYGF